MDAMGTWRQKRLLRVGEAAKILRVSRWTVYRWVEAGRLGGTRVGAGSLRIFSQTVAALIDLHCVGAARTSSGEAITAQDPSEQRSITDPYVRGDRSRLRQSAAV